MAKLNSRRWARKRREILERDRHRCVKCGKAGMLEVDHVQSIADAGEVWDNDNLQVLCRGCHIEKTRSENLARHGKPRLISMVGMTWLKSSDDMHLDAGGRPAVIPYPAITHCNAQYRSCRGIIPACLPASAL